MKDPYEKLLSRKRKWTPVKPKAGVFKSGSAETIRRALAVRHMELPVGSFISEALEKDVPEHARKLLELNVQDKTDAYAALGDDDIEDYLQDILKPEGITCDCQE